MKHYLSLILAVLLLVLPLSDALALEYTDEENLIRIQIPEDEDTLYYTPEDANLFEDLLEQVESSGRDVRLLIRRYSPEGVLVYTLEVVAYPLESLREAATASEASAAQDPAVDAQALLRPESPSRRAAEVTDILQASAQTREEAAQLIRSTFAGRFSYSEPHESQLRGVPALEVEGTGLADTSWADYDCRIYLITNDVRLLVVSLVYRRSDDQAAKRETDTVLATMLLGAAEPEATSAASQETEKPETGSPSQTAAVSSAENIATVDPGNIRKVFTDHPNLLYYLLAAAAAIIVIIALALHRRTAKKQKEWILEDEDAAWGEVQPAPVRMPEQTKVLNRTRRTEESHMGASNQPDYSVRQDPDYTEDISRYTQQPGPEVNDVSRFTHGYDEDDELSTELRALQDESFAYKPPAKIEPVGSRIERNRRKKRRK